MKKIMLIYPTGEAYQRGEDRCQVNIKASSSNALRACNDLGYVASILKKEDYSVFLRDYMAENVSFKEVEKDLNTFNPDVIFISVTNGSIFDDLKFVNAIKKIKKDILVILKGALFFNPEEDIFSELDLSQVDYLIGGEVEFIISPLLDYHYSKQGDLSKIQGISYKKENNWITNKVKSFIDNLDSIPFPDRSLIKNELYINPASNKTFATINISRGCPSSCIYCVSPIISGKKVRYRSIENIINELKECVEVRNITDFFFKSDTFTINKEWCIKLCDAIISSSLNGKITWSANSRANTIDEELILKMKLAGCNMIALGIESGSQKSLDLMKKGTTVEQNKQAVKLIKKAGLKIWGFYLIGFPWEDKTDLKLTEKLLFELDTDFIELSIATPFKGSELYYMLLDKTHKGKDVLGKDSFKYSTIGTENLTLKELTQFRKSVLLKYHLRPSYIIKKVFDKKLTFEVFKNYIKYGFRLLFNCLK